MTPRLGRRAALFLPLLLAACGGEEVPAPVAEGDFPPLRYAYLPPIPLNVQRVQMAEGFIPPSGENEVNGASPVSLADTLFAMARDRLKPVAMTGTATFRILRASVIRHHDTLDGVLEVKLDVSDADGTNTGFAVARVTASNSGPIDDLPAAVYALLKKMMFNMNVELEYQIRNKLRTWVAEPAAETPPAEPAPASGSSPAPASEPTPSPTSEPSAAPEPTPDDQSLPPPPPAPPRP